jgi:hypothetical protein
VCHNSSIDRLLIFCGVIHRHQRVANGMNIEGVANTLVLTFHSQFLAAMALSFWFDLISANQTDTNTHTRAR